MQSAQDYHEDILPKDQSVLDMIRVATYIHQIPTALDMIKAIHDKGYETTINVMAVSVVKEKELDEALEILSKSEVEVIYLVDSYGSLYSEDVQALTRKYLQYAEAAGKKIGIHTHNNQQLAYANTIESLILGASYLDSTLGDWVEVPVIVPQSSVRIPEKSQVPSSPCPTMPSGLCGSSS